MARITIDQFPTVARSGRVSKHAAEMAELEALLKEDNFGAGAALAFEVAKDDMSVLVASLRKEGKNAGRKVQTVYKDGTLYVKDNGAIGEESESATTIRAGQAAKGKK